METGSGDLQDFVKKYTGVFQTAFTGWWNTPVLCQPPICDMRRLVGVWLWAFFSRARAIS